VSESGCSGGVHQLDGGLRHCAACSCGQGRGTVGRASQKRPAHLDRRRRTCKKLKSYVDIALKFYIEKTFYLQMVLQTSGSRILSRTSGTECSCCRVNRYRCRRGAASRRLVGWRPAPHGENGRQHRMFRLDRLRGDRGCVFCSVAARPRDRPSLAMLGSPSRGGDTGGQDSASLGQDRQRHARAGRWLRRRPWGLQVRDERRGWARLIRWSPCVRPTCPAGPVATTHVVVRDLVHRARAGPCRTSELRLRCSCEPCAGDAGGSCGLRLA
jgi:hypothetical protein